MEQFEITTQAGAVLTVRRHGDPQGARVLFCHGAGLASEGFRPFWGRLADHDVFVMDLRGHGENPPCALEAFSASALVEDLGAVIAAIHRRCGRRPLHGVLHSIAAAVGLKTALLSPADFASLVLYEPALAPPPEEHVPDFIQLQATAPASALRRRAAFAAPEELRDVLLKSGPATKMTAEGALILARALLRPAPSGNLQLRCAPALEAAIYAGVTHFDLWSTVQALTLPVLVMAGGAQRGGSGYTAAIARRISAAGGFDLLTLPHLTHFGWLEQPERLAALTAAFIGHA